jgi:hypothetical protein
MKVNLHIILFFFFIVSLLLGLFYLEITYSRTYRDIPNDINDLIETMVDSSNVEPEENNYITTTMALHEKERNFPFRYTHDENGKMLPIVMIAAFFRDDKQRVTMYNEYLNNGIKIIGITAYKSFPKTITDVTGDSTSKDDTFDYYANIKVWLNCFSEPYRYGFDNRHSLLEISESDFYDADEIPVPYTKKYDLIYICFKDDEKCSMDGWNAINRNFNLALRCFPILINEFNMNILVVGRLNCGLEKQYGDKITIVDFMDYFKFQDTLKQCRMLFVPNIYDASPRVVSESIIKDIPVLMNRSIVCGSKYINDQTGELFTDENDIRFSLRRMLARIENGEMSPRNWWKQNYSKKKSAKKLRDFLYNHFPNELEKVKEVHFYL